METSFEVTVGNIGTVYSGPDSQIADEMFEHYKELSGGGYGRAAGETVTLFEDGEIAREYYAHVG